MPDELTIYPSQIRWLYRSLKKKIFIVFFLGSLAVLFFLLTRNGPSYLAEATFKQSPNRHEDLSQLQTFLQNMMQLPKDSSAMSLMHSKKVLRKVVEKMGLQIEPPALGFFSKMSRYLMAESGIFFEDQDTFQFRQVHYSGEKAASFYLKFISSDCFELLNPKKELVTKGIINQKVAFPQGEWTLVKAPASLSFNKLYPFSILPWTSSVGKLKAALKIKPSKIDKWLVELSFLHEKRHLAASILNQVMEEFQFYLLEEHEEVAQAQVNYLEKRQQFLSEQFQHSLETHAQYLAQNLDQNGFLGLSQEMEMLSIPKESYTSKLFDLDLEWKHWEQLEEGRQDFFADKNEIKCQKELVSLNFAAHPFLSIGKMETAQNNQFEAQFLGIDLKQLQELYKAYSQERELLQAQVDDSVYLKKQMALPHFEISSLSNLLKDPVSVDMIAKASHLSLELHDESNRSPKEQERIKEALDVEKRFISHYLSQNIQHLKMKLHLLDEKMAFLQNKAIQLIHNEKALIHDKLSDLHLQMKDFPKKWLLENQLKMRRDLILKIIEGMTKLTESKVVNHHLFQVESKPLDVALVPLIPKPPHLFLFSILGGLFISFFYYFCQFVRRYLRGFPLVEEWLAEKKLHFSGTLTSLSKNQDLETLRNLCGFITSPSKKVVLITGGAYGDCSQPLAELLAHRGMKIAVIETSFGGQEETFGLLPYLLGKQKTVSFIQKKGFDLLPSGGYTPHETELLNHPRFAQLLADLKKQYDCLLLLSSAKQDSQTVSSLLQHADGLIALVHQETPQEIGRLIEWEKKAQESRLTFVKLA